MWLYKYSPKIVHKITDILPLVRGNVGLHFYVSTLNNLPAYKYALHRIYLNCIIKSEMWTITIGQWYILFDNFGVFVELRKRRLYRGPNIGKLHHHRM